MDSNIEKLAEMKIAVALAHGSYEDHEYLILSILRDACWSSNRAIEGKKKWWNDKVDEAGAYAMESERAESNDAKNVAQNKSESIVDMLHRIRDRWQEELSMLEDRHEADKLAHKRVTGLDWSKPSNTGSKPVSRKDIASLKVA